MSENLIPFAQRLLGSDTVNTVYARDLYTSLELAGDYNLWITRAIKRANLLENIDFIVYYHVGENPKGGRPAVEHHLTFDASKHVAMMSRSPKAHAIRQWFIIKEKELAALLASPSPFTPLSPQPDSQLATIRMAYDLLADLGHLTERDRLMLADQARNVMQSGQRLLPAGPDTPQPARMYSIAERITALGYALTRDQAAALVPKAGKKVAVEWRERYGAEPGKEARFIDGAVRDVNAYPSAEMDWIDAVLQGYLAGFPGLRRARAVTDGR